MELLRALRETLLELRHDGFNPLEKRRVYRIRCDLPARVVLTEQATVTGRMVNLSSRGLSINLDRKLRLGHIYRISLRADDPVVTRGVRELSLRASALWCRRSAEGDSYNIGFVFFSFSGMRTDDVLRFFNDHLHLKVSQSAQRRRHPRVMREFRMVVFDDQRPPMSTMARDLSQEGALWVGHNPFREDSTVRLSLLFDTHRPLELTGRIVRCRQVRDEAEGSFEVGVHFEGLSDGLRNRLGRVLRASMLDPGSLD
ncbi:MAG TPA: PilZ domain-containing protein [Candidatus Xenobia bacterium]|jgi:hypothetical protein